MNKEEINPLQEKIKELEDRLRPDQLELDAMRKKVLSPQRLRPEVEACRDRVTQGEVQHKGDLGIDKTHERFEPMI